MAEIGTTKPEEEQEEPRSAQSPGVTQSKQEPSEILQRAVPNVTDKPWDQKSAEEQAFWLARGYATPQEVDQFREQGRVTPEQQQALVQRRDQFTQLVNDPMSGLTETQRAAAREGGAFYGTTPTSLMEQQSKDLRPAYRLSEDQVEQFESMGYMPEEFQLQMSPESFEFSGPALQFSQDGETTGVGYSDQQQVLDENALPPNAIARDRYGRPVYMASAPQGSGAFKQVLGDIKRGIDTWVRSAEAHMTGEVEPLRNVWENVDAPTVGEWGKFAAYAAAGVGIGVGVGAAVASAPITIPGAAIGAGILGGMGLWSQHDRIDKVVENVLGGRRPFAEIPTGEERAQAQEGTVLGEGMQLASNITQRANNLPVAPLRDVSRILTLGLGTLGEAFGVPGIALKRMAGTVAGVAQGFSAEEAYAASSITWTAAFTGRTLKDYVDRYRGGEDAFLLQMELENPEIELWGEIVVDPLWFIGAKVGQSMDATQRAVAAARNTVRAESATAKAIDAVADVSRGAKGTRAVDNLDEVVRLGLDEVTANANKTVDTFQDVARDYGFTRPVARAKQGTWGNVAKDYLARLAVSSGGDAQHMQQTLMDWVAVSSPHMRDDVRQLAFMRLSQSDAATVLMSERGLMVGQVMGDLALGGEGGFSSAKLGRFQQVFEEVQDMMHSPAAKIAPQGYDDFMMQAQRHVNEAHASAVKSGRATGEIPAARDFLESVARRAGNADEALDSLPLSVREGLERLASETDTNIEEILRYVQAGGEEQRSVADLLDNVWRTQEEYNQGIRGATGQSAREINEGVARRLIDQGHDEADLLRRYLNTDLEGDLQAKLRAQELIDEARTADEAARVGQVSGAEDAAVAGGAAEEGGGIRAANRIVREAEEAGEDLGDAVRRAKESIDNVDVRKRWSESVEDILEERKKAAAVREQMQGVETAQERRALAIEYMVDEISGPLERQLQRTFPKILDRVEYQKQIAQLDQEGKTLPRWLERFRGDSIPSNTEWIARQHDWLQKKIYGPVVGALSDVWMGASLPFGIRNFIVDSVVSAIDRPGAMFHRIESLNNFQRKVAGALGVKAQFGFRGPATATSTRRSVNIFGKDIPLFGYAIAEGAEKFHSQRVYGYGFKKTFENMWDTTRRSLRTILEDGGMNADEIQKFENLVVRHDYDIDAAVRAWHGDDAAARRVLNVSRKENRVLNEFGQLGDELREARAAATSADDFAQRADDIMERHRRFIDFSAKEEAIIPEDSQFFPEWEKITRDAGMSTSKWRGDLLARRVLQTEHARISLGNAFDDLGRKLAHWAGAQRDTQLQTRIDDIMTAARRRAQEAWAEEGRLANEARVAVKDAADAAVREGEHWRADQLWDDFLGHGGRRDRLHNSMREKYFQAYEEGLEQLRSISPEADAIITDFNPMAEALEAVETSRLLDDADPELFQLLGRIQINLDGPATDLMHRYGMMVWTDSSVPRSWSSLATELRKSTPPHIPEFTTAELRAQDTMSDTRLAQLREVLESRASEVEHLEDITRVEARAVELVENLPEAERTQAQINRARRTAENQIIHEAIEELNERTYVTADIEDEVARITAANPDMSTEDAIQTARANVENNVPLPRASWDELRALEDVEDARVRIAAPTKDDAAFTLSTDHGSIRYTIDGDTVTLTGVNPKTAGGGEVAFEHFLQDIERRGIHEFRVSPQQDEVKTLMQDMTSKRRYVEPTEEIMLRGEKSHVFEIADTAAGRTQTRGGLITRARQEVKAAIRENDMKTVNIARAESAEDLVDAINTKAPGLVELDDIPEKEFGLARYNRSRMGEIAFEPTHNINWSREAVEGGDNPMGLVPLQQQLDAGKGHTMALTPEEFLDLVPARPSPPGEEFRSLVAGGQETAPPWLDVGWDADAGEWVVRGHEGRGRAMIAADLEEGNPIEVDIIYREQGDLAVPANVTEDMKRAPIRGDDRLPQEVRVTPRSLEDIPKEIQYTPFEPGAEPRMLEAGHYQHRGLEIKKSGSRWEVLDPGTGDTLDSFSTLKEASREIDKLGDITVSPMAMESLGVDALRETMVHELGHEVMTRILELGDSNLDQTRGLFHSIGVNIDTQEGFLRADEIMADAVSEYIHNRNRLAKGESRIANLADIAANEQKQIYALIDEIYPGLDQEMVEFIDAVGGRAKTTFAMADDAQPQRPVQTANLSGHHTEAGVAAENEAGLTSFVENLKAKVRDNWARDETPPARDPRVEGALNEYRRSLKPRLQENIAVSQDVAGQWRDFVLHDYNQRYGYDLAAQMVYPYQFWYRSTYMKSIERIMRNPAVLASYYRYRNYLDKKHADLPEWWRYNVTSNELLGVDWENPLYFNLDAMLNPLHHMADNDFEDPAARQTWWGATMADLGRFGPTPFWPFEAAVGVASNLTGHPEQGEAFLGSRLVPQTQVIKSATALAGIGGPSGVELDPMVWLQMGGEGTKWEVRRIGRAMGALVREGKITEAQADDAAHAQEGPIWEMAQRRAALDRAPGNLLSGIFGVGAKGRTQSEVDIDQGFDAMYKLISARRNLSPEEYRTAWADWEQQFPFMTAVLLSRKAGAANDQAYVWSVLSRVPPGQSSDFFDMVGLNDALVDEFYESKGDMSDWHSSDRNALMGAAESLGAILEVPPDGIRREWEEARIQYSRMMNAVPEEVQHMTDVFYAKLEENPEDARAFREAHPEIEQYLQYREQTIMQNPLLFRYYGGFDFIEKSWRRQMYAEAEDVFGSDIQDIQSAFFDISDMGGDTRSFLANHPQLAGPWGDHENGYWGWLREEKGKIGERLDEVADMIPADPQAIIRPDANQESVMAMQTLEAMRESAPTMTDREVAIAPYLEAGSRGSDDFSITNWIDVQAEKRWPGVINKDERYRRMSVENPFQAQTYLAENQDLQQFKAWEREVRTNYNRLQRQDEPSNPTEMAQTMNWDMWQQTLDPSGAQPYVPRLTVDYFRTGELSRDMLEQLRERWVIIGRPMGSFDAWLEEMEQSWRASLTQ